MKKYSYLLPLAILPLLFSCGSEANELDSSDNPKKEISFDGAKKMTFEEAMAINWEEPKPVIIEGYFQLPFSATVTESGQSSYLFGRRNQTRGYNMYAYVPLGSGNNQMSELKSGFLAKDFKAKDDGGHSVGLNERVKATGLLYSTKSYSKDEPNRVYFEIKKFEKVDEVEADYASMNFPTFTKEIADNKSEHAEKPFVAEGRLELPMFVLTGDDMTVDLIDQWDTKLSLKVLKGTGKSQMEDLPSNWTKEDIKIRDNQGNLLTVGSKVRVYGVLALDGLHVEYIEAL